ncbi:phosphate ABC transporter substrate-binding protein [Pseudanabaena sp. PCC 6802]|uniref:phosphate ABC transporter substrate-binding protein n=1 Tax=Pseudanabaena sp. PCC 6802 TaxID=118173 RepID=UPI00034AC219|nr:phosphate ABC transporter substrate-binding protein [Pseudanabaena sp. PCC 6802]
MARGKETTALLLTLLVTAGVAGGGYWYFQQNANNPKVNSPQPLNSPTPNSTSVSTPSNGVSLDTSVPDPSVLSIDGSTTLVLPIRELRNAYAQLNPNIPTTFGIPDGKPGGTDKGIQNLINNSVVIAASSRPLKPNEAQAGIQLIAIAKDSIAVVIGSNNPFKSDLTVGQLRDIYSGKITNWSQVGGTNLPIKVINRATTSGTRSLFQDTVMLGQPFAPDSANFITWPQDETTAILRTIGNNGISYATVSQVANQEIVRIVSIEGKSPLDVDAVKSGAYPISRSLFLAVRKQTSPAVKQFVDLALSPQSQQTLQRLGFVPIR